LEKQGNRKFYSPAVEAVFHRLPKALSEERSCRREKAIRKIEEDDDVTKCISHQQE